MHEDELDIEVNIAVKTNRSEGFKAYCNVIAANYAMMQIDVVDFPIKREIYYMEDEL